VYVDALRGAELDGAALETPFDSACGRREILSNMPANRLASNAHAIRNFFLADIDPCQCGAVNAVGQLGKRAA
jgi:hypothetical protein